MKREDFEILVLEALERIPEEFRRKMQNVEILVEPQSSPSSLLGLYQGIPFPKRGIYYSAVLPDKIVLYQKPIESMCRTREDIKRAVREVIIHEIGHYFGLSENDLS